MFGHEHKANVLLRMDALTALICGGCNQARLRRMTDACEYQSEAKSMTQPDTEVD
jgi:hypothetical protein